MGPPDRDHYRAAWRHPGNHDSLKRVFFRIRLDLWPRAEHRHQVRHERISRRRTSIDPSRWQLAGEDLLDQGLLPTVRAELRHAHHTPSYQPGGHSGRAEPGLRLDWRADHEGQDLLLRHD